MTDFSYKQPKTTDSYRKGIERIFGKWDNHKTDAEVKHKAFESTE